MSDDDWDKEDFVPPPVVTAPAAKEADKPKESWEGKDVPVDEAKEKALEKADAEAAAGVYAGMTKEQLIEELSKRDRDISSAKKLAAQQSNRERQRLEKEREKQEQARLALQRASEVPLTAEEQYAKKMADQQKAEESDLAAAMDLFGGLDDGPAKPAAKPAAKAAPAAAAAAPKGPVTLIEAMEPKTQLEFDKMREAIVKKVSKYQEVNFYPMFTQNLVKSICEGLKVEDSRKIVTVVNNVINEKVAAEKAKTKKPNKKNLPTLGNKAKLRDDDDDDMFGDLEDEVERRQEIERIKLEKKMKNRELETGPE